MISHGKADNITLPEILSKISESEILYHYLGIKDIPCVINSPLREDRNPSFGLYSIDGEHIYYRDFSTKETGNTFTLLKNLWGINFQEVLNRIQDDLIKNNYTTHTIVGKSTRVRTISNVSDSKLDVKVRDWRDYDLKYWGSYGITLDWLKWADVYPISHKIITKVDKQYVFPADKYSYVYVEHKDAKVQLKIYSPYNKKGFKWCTSTDRSVWSLWDKIPQFGDNLIITSSLKDCLNIMANLYIPAICLQGEGYNPKPHVVQQLINRYKNIVLFYDNDYNSLVNSGRKDALVLHKQYGFPMVEIPAYFEAKDPSDLYKKYGKESYLNIMKFILKNKLWKKNGNL